MKQAIVCTIIDLCLGSVFFLNIVMLQVSMSPAIPTILLCAPLYINYLRLSTKKKDKNLRANF